jgi:integrase
MKNPNKNGGFRDEGCGNGVGNEAKKEEKMGIYLRGNVWWMEYRTRSVRKRASSGFAKADKAKALAAFEAFKLGLGCRPKRSAMEGILAAIYGDGVQAKGIPLSAVWGIYEDWCEGKGRTVAKSTLVNRRNLFQRFLKFAEERGAHDISDVSVLMAREYVVSLGRTNKTQRTYCGYLSGVGEAIGQLHPGIHNPWKAACPDNDGSSVRHEAFTETQIKAILSASKDAGHDWHRACLLALYTGLRYGDIATLQWEQVDLKARIIKVKPNKTRKSSGIEVWIPIAAPLYEELKGGGEGFVLPEHGVKYPMPMDVPFSSVLAAVGIKGREFSFHSWRHTANTRMADAGVPSAVREMICGWTGANMAKHYDHARHLKELAEAVAKI